MLSAGSFIAEDTQLIYLCLINTNGFGQWWESMRREHKMTFGEKGNSASRGEKPLYCVVTALLEIAAKSSSKLIF